MRRLILRACLLTTLLVSCSAPPTAPAQGEPVPVEPAEPAFEVAVAPTAIPHADALRLALIGQPTEVNAWALFDESGASYVNRALHADETPRLYRLSVPALEFEEYLADGQPSPVTQEGDFYTATVRLKSGLRWSNGAPITAQDVAFTANTALAYRLRFDWSAAYHPSLLERVEAVTNLIVKFYFKSPFTVADWQYGALQGPLLSRAFWEAQIAPASALLPPAELSASMAATQTQADDLQRRIEAGNASLLTLTPNSRDYNELTVQINRHQDNLNALHSKLGKMKDEYEASLAAARTALFALSAQGEPTFGPFLRASAQDGMFVREVDPGFPFAKPNYDRAIYRILTDESAARAALDAGEVDILLNETNGSPAQADKPSASGGLRFLAFNPARAELADPALRSALACVAGSFTPAGTLVAPSFVPAGNVAWKNRDASLPCAGLDAPARLPKAVEMLKAAGYDWSNPPATGQPGQGLTQPNGQSFPAVVLLVAGGDDLRAEMANAIEEQARLMGIPLTIQVDTPAGVRYAVYGSGRYDMALLGWQVSLYPGYLCDWFGDRGAFAYNGDRLRAACAALNSTADLATAQQSVLEIQSILMAGLPFIPLYEELKYEAYRNVNYPFETVPGGVSSLYGAPALAMPAP